jgi:hypothetical protein
MAAAVDRRTVGAVLQNSIRGVTMDATLTDEAGVEVKWSSHPIETGAEIQDHGTVSPRTYTLTGVVSRTTLGPVLPDDPRRVEIARDTLFAMAEDRLPVELFYDTFVLESYVITSVRSSRDSGTGQALRFSIGLQALRVTVSETTEIPADRVASDQAAGLTATSDGGQQVAAESTGEEVKQEVRTSIAAAGFDFLVGG